MARVTTTTQLHTSAGAGRFLEAHDAEEGEGEGEEAPVQDSVVTLVDTIEETLLEAEDVEEEAEAEEKATVQDSVGRSGSSQRRQEVPPVSL